MTFRALLIGCFFLGGCSLLEGGSTEDITNPGGNNPPGDNSSVTVPDGNPAESISGDLSQGSVMSDLSWAQSSFCWVATEDQNFDGAHVFYQFDQPPGLDFYLRADPADDVDVSVYYLQYPAGDGREPPDTSVSIFDCDTQFDAISDSNPGQAEVLFVQNNAAYDLIVGVAGAGGATSGAYTLEVYTENGTLFPQE